MVVVAPRDACSARDRFDLLDHTSWIAHHQRVWWNVTSDHSTGADHRVCANGDAGRNRHIHTHLHATLQRRPTHALSREGAAWVQVVGNGDARRQKDVIFHNGELCDVAVSVNLYVVTDAAAIVDGGIVPDLHMLSEYILLSDHHIVSGLELFTNR